MSKRNTGVSLQYTVFSFYKDLPIKVRTTQYKNKTDMFEYCGGLQFTDTPFIAVSPDARILDIKTDDYFTRERMAEWIEKYVITKENEPRKNNNADTNKNKP